MGTRRFIAGSGPIHPEASKLETCQTAGLSALKLFSTEEVFPIYPLICVGQSQPIIPGIITSTNYQHCRT